jgi:uncharacterized membrane protein
LRLTAETQSTLRDRRETIFEAKPPQRYIVNRCVRSLAEYRDIYMGAAKYSAVFLSAIGLYIAAYFTLVYYKIISANTKLMPNVCRLEEHSCQTVLGSRFARVFGVPNSLLGVGYYVIVTAVLLSGLSASGVTVGLLAVAWFTVALGVLLAYSLFFIIKIPCPLCLTAHTINLTLAILLTSILT